MSHISIIKEKEKQIIRTKQQSISKIESFEFSWKSDSAIKKWIVDIIHVLQWVIVKNDLQSHHCVSIYDQLQMINQIIIIVRNDACEIHLTQAVNHQQIDSFFFVFSRQFLWSTKRRSSNCSDLLLKIDNIRLSIMKEWQILWNSIIILIKEQSDWWEKIEFICCSWWDWIWKLWNCRYDSAFRWHISQSVLRSNLWELRRFGSFCECEQFKHILMSWGLSIQDLFWDDFVWFSSHHCLIG